MSEEENVSVETQESQEAVAQATEQENVNEKRQESAEERKRRNDVEYNWAEARRKMQELERQKQEMAERLSRLEQKNVPTVDDELDKIGEDEIVSKAQVKKLVAKAAKEIAQQAIQQREAATVEERVVLKFPDYNATVTRENIEYLKEQEPELASSLAHNPDPMAQAVAVYKAIKRIGVASDPKPNPEKEKALRNAQKPLSVNAVSKQSAIGNAHLFENGLTPDLKKQLYEEMRQAAKHA